MIYPGGVDHRGRTHEVGSLGAAVRHTSCNRPLMLTAAHVVGSLSAAHPLGQKEVLLGRGPAPLSGDPLIGDAVASHPPEPSDVVELDACLVALQDHVDLRQEVRGGVVTSGRPREMSTVPEDDTIVVHKRGINSPGLTSGLLDPEPVALQTELSSWAGRGVLRDYPRGYLITGTDAEYPFARGGDSGSIIIDDDDCVLGMIVALITDSPTHPRPGDPAFMVGINDVLAGLDIRLVGPDRPCTCADYAQPSG
ncbi:MAG: hypothetical protein ACR2LY_05750 [Thermoleophilaceae bacterium]